MTSKKKFAAPAPDVQSKMEAIEAAAEQGTQVPQGKKPLPEELVSGDKNSQVAFTVRIEKDLKERLAFLVMVMKKSGDRNITVASTVESVLRAAVNAELEALGYETAD